MWQPLLTPSRRTFCPREERPHHLRHRQRDVRRRVGTSDERRRETDASNRSNCEWDEISLPAVSAAVFARSQGIGTGCVGDSGSRGSGGFPVFGGGSLPPGGLSPCVGA